MKTLACTFDEQAGSDPAVGLIVLQSDEVLERELRAWLPTPLRILHTRIPNDTHVTAETLGAMEHELPAAARLLPAATRFDVIAYGCTSASTVIGEARVAELIQTVVPDAAVTDPITALRAQLEHLGIHRIALLTPYSAAVSEAVAQRLGDHGIDVRHLAIFDEPDDRRVARISESSVLEAMIAAGCQDDCDAVFGSCTNLRALGILNEAMQRLGKPVMTSNSALAWHIQHLLPHPQLP